MKIAIVDIGTNTCRLAVFQLGQDVRHELIIERNVITRLGEGLSPGSALKHEAVGRTIETLQSFKNEIDEIGCTGVVAVGTQALREAANGNEFLRAVSGVGFDVEVITGEEEAMLSFRGVVSGLETMPARLLVFDTGGGSTEFTSYAGGIVSVSSVKLGAVRGRTEFFHHDPPTAEELSEFEKHCEQVIQHYVAKETGDVVDKCIGVAGTITTLAMIDLGLPAYDSEAVHGHIISAENTDRLTDELCRMDDRQRSAIPGIQPCRADIIHAGAVIVRAIINVFQLNEISISERDIRHGLLMREIEKLK